MFVVKEDFENSKQISRGLIDYNNSIIGKLPYEENRSIMLDGDEIIGVVSSNCGWDIIEVDGLWVKDINNTASLINEVYKAHFGKSTKVRYQTGSVEYKNKLVDLGFEVIHTFIDMPVNSNTFVLLNKDFEVTETKHTFTNEDSNESLNKKCEKIFEEHVPDEDEGEFVYSVKDGDILVGGIKGTFSNNYIAVYTLWVSDDYRNNGIASLLMKHVEKVGKQKGLAHSWLSTCTFQAKGFYEKLGYEVQCIVKGVPIGQDDHLMTKSL